MGPLLLFESYDTNINVFGKLRALKCMYHTRLHGVSAQWRCIGRDGGLPRTASVQEGECCAA